MVDYDFVFPGPPNHDIITFKTEREAQLWVKRLEENNRVNVEFFKLPITYTNIKITFGFDPTFLS